MSISQMAPFLTGIPTDKPPPRYYFMYEDHFSHEAFQKHFVATKKVTFGFLKDWTWHINAKQKPNIRFTFKEYGDKSKGPIVAPATKFVPPRLGQNDGTFGFVMELSPELRSILERVYDIDKVAMVQDVFAWVRRPDGHMVKAIVKALVYWDPLYTADGLRKNVLEDKCQREKWKKGLLTLKSLGVPDGYLNALQGRLVGQRVDPEPLFADFPRRPKPLMPKHIQRGQHNHQQYEKRPSSQISFPVPQQMPPPPPPPGSSPNTPNVPHALVIQGAMGPPSRPLTVVQHQPAIQTSTRQVTRPISCPSMAQQNGSIQDMMRPPPRSITQYNEGVHGETRPPPMSTPTQPMAQQDPAIPGQSSLTRDVRASMYPPNIQRSSVIPGQAPTGQHVRASMDSPNVQHGPAIQSQMTQNASLQNMLTAQRNAALRAYILQQGPPIIHPGRIPDCNRAVIAQDRCNLQISGTKRNVDSNEDRLTEELKRMKREGHVGGKPPLA